MYEKKPNLLVVVGDRHRIDSAQLDRRCEPEDWLVWFCVGLVRQRYLSGRLDWGGRTGGRRGDGNGARGTAAGAGAAHDRGERADEDPRRNSTMTHDGMLSS